MGLAQEHPSELGTQGQGKITQGFLHGTQGSAPLFPPPREIALRPSPSTLHIEECLADQSALRPALRTPPGADAGGRHWRRITLRARMRPRRASATICRSHPMRRSTWRSHQLARAISPRSGRCWWKNSLKQRAPLISGTPEGPWKEVGGDCCCFTGMVRLCHRRRGLSGQCGLPWVIGGGCSSLAACLPGASLTYIWPDVCRVTENGLNGKYGFSCTGNLMNRIKELVEMYMKNNNKTALFRSGDNEEQWTSLSRVS